MIQLVSENTLIIKGKSHEVIRHLRNIAMEYRTIKEYIDSINAKLTDE